MTRTYGTLHHLVPKEGAHKSIRPAWGLDCEPQVAMRVKRVFARVQQNRQGLLTITDTPEVARDLEWFLQRYPMEVRPETLALLTARADQRRRQEETVLAVLGGQMEVELPEGMEPARPLYDFQRQASDLVLASRRLLLTDDVGLGKTTSAIGVFRHPDALPAVFVTLTHLPEQMRDEMAVVLPWLTGYAVTRGQPHDLSKARGNGGRFPDVVFLSYSKLANWAPALAGVARTVVFDEMQELRHDGTNKYVAAGMIADQAHFVMGLTATPVYNYGGEIFNVMNVLAPDALGTREEFTREWGAGVTSSGQVRVKDPGALGHWLTEQGLMLGRTRKDVGRELPPVVTIKQTVAADLRRLEGGMAETADLAELLLDPTTEAKDRFLMAGQLDYKLRHATGVAKAPFVAEFVRLLLESEDKVVLYLWHHDVYDEIAARLEKAGHRTLRYSGKESPNQKREAKAAFVQPSDQGGARVLMMSLRAGAGLDGLQQVCSCVVFGELDWSPGRHVQAIGRVARDGQQNPVAAYFLHSEDGSDPVILPVLNTKAMQSEPIVRPDEDHDAKITPDVSSQRMRMLAKAVLQRQGRPVPMALEREPDPAEVADLFPAAEPEPVVDQLDLFGADA